MMLVIGTIWQVHCLTSVASALHRSRIFLYSQPAFYRLQDSVEPGKSETHIAQTLQVKRGAASVAAV